MTARISIAILGAFAVLAAASDSYGGASPIGATRKLLEAGAAANLNLNIDPVEIINEIQTAVKTSANRAAAIEDAVNKAWYAPSNNGRYNVLCFNLQVSHTVQLNDVKVYTSFVYDTITYGVWVFTDGKFINGGDGGDINWRFMGWFSRSGDQGHTVTFTKG